MKGGAGFRRCFGGGCLLTWEFRAPGGRGLTAAAAPADAEIKPFRPAAPGPGEEALP
jgi:hypothetical protein